MAKVPKPKDRSGCSLMLAALLVLPALYVISGSFAVTMAR